MRLVGGIVIAFLLVFLAGCRKHEVLYPYGIIEYSYYDTLRNARYVIDGKKVAWYMDSLRLSSRDTAFVDLFVDKYYASRQPYLWIDTKGADCRVDSLEKILSSVSADGINLSSVYHPYIKKALQCLRNFDFKTCDINLCLAQIEYYSTKGLVRYACGMRFGFVNPYKFYNRMDLVNDEDTLCTDFRTLYDTPTETPGREYLSELLDGITEGSFPEMAEKALCRDSGYLRLREEYQKKEIGIAKKRVIAVNMERYRWRMKNESERKEGGKYVWINLPEFMLRAVDEESGETLEMKVCEGSLKHKTPQLASEVGRLELNPVWTVPQSIISREIAPKHAEDESYFERNRMKVIEKSTGEEIEPSVVSAEMLKSGKYNVVQNKGEGNSLGRMIFRFKNNFAIFLHDTPNREAFNRTFRAVSHGCVRLEKPLELAVFMLADKDPLVIDKMRIAVGLPPESEEGKRLAAKEDARIMGLKTFKPPVPLYITYLTAYPGRDGNIVYTPDPYGYDGRLLSVLRNY